MLEGLIYISAPDTSLEKSDVVDILNKARAKNASENITGILLYSPAMFIQVLEGQPASLDIVMKRITADGRHSNVSVLSRDRIEDRAFSNWSMAFRDIDENNSKLLSAEIGWDTANKKMRDIPNNYSLAMLITSISQIVTGA